MFRFAVSWRAGWSSYRIFDGTDSVAPVVFVALGDLLATAVEEERLLPERVLPEREEPESMPRAARISFLKVLDLREFFLP